MWRNRPFESTWTTALRLELGPPYNPTCKWIPSLLSSKCPAQRKGRANGTWNYVAAAGGRGWPSSLLGEKLQVEHRPGKIIIRCKMHILPGDETGSEPCLLGATSFQTAAESVYLPQPRWSCYFLLKLHQLKLPRAESQHASVSYGCSNKSAR